MLKLFGANNKNSSKPSSRRTSPKLEKDEESKFLQAPRSPPAKRFEPQDIR